MDGNIFEGLVAQPDEQVFSPGTDSPSDSPTEIEETAPSQAEDNVEDVPNDLDDRPLHKDKRFKTVISERNTLRDENIRLQERVRLIEEGKSETPSNQKSSDKPEWFKRYFGDDEEAWAGFQSMTSKAKDQAKKEALEEFDSKQTEAQETQKRANDWVEEQVSSLKETEGDFDRNALFKILDKYKPTDAEGNLDFKAGLEILRLQQPDTKEKSVARRKLADSLNAKGGKSEPSSRGYVTSAQLRKMGGWDSVSE